MGALNVTAARPAVRVERDFAAAPDKVFDAWLDAALVARWMAPGSVTCDARIEPRRGGHYRIIHSVAGKPIGGFDARIVELDRPRRLVFAWGLVGPDNERGPRFDSRLTLTFDAAPSGTRLVLLHEQLDDFAVAHPEIADQIEAGWENVLAKLAGVIE